MWQSLCPLEETPHIGGVRWECSRVLGEGISWSEGRSPLLITRVRGRERRGTNALDELRGGGALWGCGGRVACGGWVVRGVGRECQQHPLDEGEHIKTLDGQFHTKYRFFTWSSAMDSTTHFCTCFPSTSIHTRARSEKWRRHSCSLQGQNSFIAQIWTLMISNWKVSRKS